MKAATIRLSVLLSFATGAISNAQVLYQEGFDSEADTNVQVDQSPDTNIEFVDYSSFMLGAATHSIPEAPNRVAGSAATRGVVMQANLTNGAAAAVNMTATDAGDEPLEFSGNYRVTFDMYLGLDPTATTASSGTTEQGGWAVGHDGGVLVGRLNKDTVGLSGTWGWLATENGYGTEDAIIIENNFPQLAKVSNGSTPALFAEAFPEGGPIADAANNTWVEVEVTVLDGVVTVNYNGVEFFSQPSNTTEGFALITYEDFFSSLSFSQDYQFGLFDNWKIEVAIPPTLEIAQEEGFEVLTEEGATSTVDFIVTNDGDAPLTVNEVNITGDDASAFTLDSPLPLVVPVAGNDAISITFTAGGDRGAKEASVEFVTTDSLSPSVSLPLEALFPALLMAHYKLDETSGTTMVEATGDGPDGAFIVRDPLGYGSTGLAGGTSIGFTAADAGNSGNLALANVLHVPTTSISMWVRPEAGTGGEDVLFNRDPGFTGADAIYGCFLDDSGGVTVRTGGDVTLVSELGAVSDGQTHHIVFTHLDQDGFGNATATRSRLYIDGAMVAESNSPTGFDVYPNTAATRELYIASRTAAGAGYDGLIDDIQIYAFELDPAQVANMAAAPGITALEDVPQQRITDVSYNEATGVVTLTWDSLPGALYVIEGTTNLETGGVDGWGEIEDSIKSMGTSTTRDVQGVSGPLNFYRVIRQEN